MAKVVNLVVELSVADDVKLLDLVEELEAKLKAQDERVYTVYPLHGNRYSG